MEEQLNLLDQIALARSLFENGDKVKALLEKRDKLAADLAKIDEELSELLPAAPTTNGSSRAKQTCKFVLADGNVCGSTEHNARFHKEK